MGYLDVKGSSVTGFALVFVVAARMDALGFYVLTVKHEHMGFLVVHPDDGVTVRHVKTLPMFR